MTNETTVSAVQERLRILEEEQEKLHKVKHEENASITEGEANPEEE